MATAYGRTQEEFPQLLYDAQAALREGLIEEAEGFVLVYLQSIKAALLDLEERSLFANKEVAELLDVLFNGENLADDVKIELERTRDAKADECERIHRELTNLKEEADRHLQNYQQRALAIITSSEF
jgi:hypothetical protein